MNLFLNLVKKFHLKHIHKKRIEVLSHQIKKWIPPHGKVLDIGCGDGILAYAIQQNVQAVIAFGAEVKERERCAIPYFLFSGERIPLKDNSVDVCLFIDVLHHTDNIEKMIREAARVTRHYVIIKDHLCENKYQYYLLKLMDWVGNKPHQVVIPYNYYSKKQWQQDISKQNLKILFWTTDIPLYSLPLNIIFGKNLHCLIILEKINSAV
jgi:ubiquinone/menaquinone biosynthesis C-methylase UbiE